MGLSKSSANFEQQHLSSFLSYPFVRPPSGASFRPDLRSRRAAARRGGQGWPSPSRSSTRSISRPLLDGPEHGGRLGRVGNRATGGDHAQQRVKRRRSEASPPGWQHRSRATSLYSVDPLQGIGTMMQLCASAARTPRRQAHSRVRHGSHGKKTGHCHLGSSRHPSRWESAINAGPVPPSPAFGPEVKGVVQVDVSQER